MSDLTKVIIAGIGNQTHGLSGWATEKTLNEIKELLKAEFGSNDNEEHEKTVEENLSDINDNSKQQAEDTSDIKKQTEKSDEEQKRRDNIAEASKERHASALQYKLESLKTHIGYEREGFMRHMLGQFGAVGTVIGAVIDQIWASTMRASDTFTQAYKAGALFEEGLTNGNSAFDAFLNASINTGISLSHLSEISRKYSVMMNQVGIQRFGELTDTMAVYGSRYAMTNLEAADYLGEYIEMTRQLGNLERLEAYTTADAFDKSTRGVKMFSSAIGISMADFQKSMADLSKNTDIRRVMANVSEKSRSALLSVFAMWEKTGQTGIAETVKRMLESPAVMARETAKIGAWLGADAADSIHEFVGAAMDGTLSLEDHVEMAKRLTDSLSRQGNFDEVMHMLSLFAASGDSTAIMLKDMVVSAKLAKEQLDKSAAAEAADKAKFSTKVSNLVERLSGALDKILGNILTDDFVKVLSDVIDGLESNVEGFSRNLKPFIESIGRVLEILPTKIGEWLYSTDLFMSRLKEWGEGKIGTTAFLFGGKTEGQERIEAERKKSLISELNPIYKGSFNLEKYSVDELTKIDRIHNRNKVLERTKDSDAKRRIVEENISDMTGKDASDLSGYKPNLTENEMYSLAYKQMLADKSERTEMIHLLHKLVKSTEDVAKATKDNIPGG